jgi:hypothetical protein
MASLFVTLGIVSFVLLLLAVLGLAQAKLAEYKDDGGE